MDNVVMVECKPVDEFESALLARVRQGDERATTAMLNKYQGWADWYTWRIIRVNKVFARYYQDVRQEVLIAMIKAMRAFDPERGQSLTSYMCLVVGRDARVFLFKHIGTTITIRQEAYKTSMLCSDRKADAYQETNALLELCDTYAELTDQILDQMELAECLLPRPDDVVEHNDAIERLGTILEEALVVVGDRDQSVVRTAFSNDFTTYDDLAAVHRVSRERVRQICRRFVQIIRSKADELGICLDSIVDA